MEILFRGKWIDNGEWIRGDLITTPFIRNITQQNIIYILDVTKADYDCFEDLVEDNGIFEVDPETVCQYTGKADCNDVPIWEEDYVKINDDWIGRIVWQDKDTAFCVFPNDDIEHETYCLGHYIEEGYRVEVIGNVFDNPDLREA